MMPSCCPVSSMTRTSRTRMRSLTACGRPGADSFECDNSLLRARIRFPDARPSSRASRAFAISARRAMNSSTAALAQIPAGAAAHRHRALGLAVADDQHVGDLLQLRLADLISNLLLALVELGPQPGRRQRSPHRPRVVEVPVGNRQHDALHRRQPQRERAGVVLDQERDEPLEAAEDRPVDHHRPVLGVVGADVLQVEPLRHLVVELDRRALPLAADRVGDVEVDLRPVERAVALVERCRPDRRARAPA